MADIVERLIELISVTEPLEDKMSGVVAGFIERTAVKLSRLEGGLEDAAFQDVISGEGDSQTA